MAINVNFAMSWKRAVESTKKVCEKTMKEAVEELLTNIVDATPVDTGNLRANWQTTLNAGSGSTVDFLDPSGARAKQGISSTVYNWKLGTNIYFSNNAPYAEKIEYGYSQRQAPAGMVRINLVRFGQIVDKYARKNKD